MTTSRRAALRRPTARQAGAGTLVVLALALGQWIDARLPETASASRPYEVPVAVGGTAELRTGDLEVLGVAGAPSVVVDGTTRVSPGLFTFVELAWTPRGRSSSLTYAELRDGEGRVLPIAGGRNVLSCPGGVTGLPGRCTVVVEAAPDTLAGASIAVGPDLRDSSWDSLAVIDLGIDTSTTDEWAGHTEPVHLPSAGPFEVAEGVRG
ncbi:hypothetical protein [Nocardioides daphniae]|uniref:Uncharacterized protein n=1 Tax=Nocardioides daphniae TaxID=402297 RepID=A0ABQ1Q9V5_9ACTN|nr:hypothetical protein [Nocardioides daphniae]GGD19496.1 hypothetical protein GCM10007231_18310 [Nocardioides daphniae]